MESSKHPINANSAYPRPVWPDYLERSGYDLAEEIPKLEQHWHTCSYCPQGFVDASNAFCESTLQWKAYFEENVFSNKTSDQVVQEIATLPDACKPLLFIWYGMSLAKPVRSDSSVAKQVQGILDETGQLAIENQILRGRIEEVNIQNSDLKASSRRLNALVTILNNLLQSHTHLRESVQLWHGNTDAPIKAPALMRYVARYVNELSKALGKLEQSFVDEKARVEEISKSLQETDDALKQSLSENKELGLKNQRLIDQLDDFVLTINTLLGFMNKHIDGKTGSMSISPAELTGFILSLESSLNLLAEDVPVLDVRDSRDLMSKILQQIPKNT